MKENRSDGQLALRKARIISIIRAEGAGREEDKAQYAPYFPDTPEGAELCAAFSDEELLELLRETARRLGRSPAQGEVHQLLREYIRSRFRNWPGALRAAGLSRSAGRGGQTCQQSVQKELEVRQLLAQVRERAKALGRIPHPSELPEVCQSLKKRYRTWGEVLSAAGAEEAAAAGLRKLEDLDQEDRQRLDALQAIAQALNRAPMSREVEEGLRIALLQRFGSWRNALYQIDLEPVRRISPFVNAPLHREAGRSRAAHRWDVYDCHYKLLRLDQKTAANLELIRHMAQQLGRPPRRREVPPEIRLQLRAACGSWSNALFQLGFRDGAS